jgi:hypothetical protein
MVKMVVRLAPPEVEATAVTVEMAVRRPVVAL